MEHVLGRAAIPFPHVPAPQLSRIGLYWVQPAGKKMVLAVEPLRSGEVVPEVVLAGTQKLAKKRTNPINWEFLSQLIFQAFFLWLCPNIKTPMVDFINHLTHYPTVSY